MGDLPSFISNDNSDITWDVEMADSLMSYYKVAIMQQCS